MTGPLAGIRIIELEGLGPVPLAAMLLADMGADVVRIARPPSLGAGAWDDVGGAILHRGRAVIHINLKDPDDRTRLLDLIERADGLVEGFRPGVMERLGIGPDVCLARNPRLVFGRMTGWGQTGPMALRAGHDINYIALTGALHAMGEAGKPPPVPLNLVGDYGGGTMFLVTGMLAAILAARTSGTGQVIDACITDGVASFMSVFHGLISSGAWKDARASNLFDGAAPFYRCYTCADGKYVAVGCLEPQFFAAMVEGLGLAARGYRQSDRADWPRMEADFAATFASRDRDHWAALFEPIDACVSAVLSMAEAVAHPHNVARGTYVEKDEVTQPACVPRFSATPGTIGSSGVELGVAELLDRWT